MLFTTDRQTLEDLNIFGKHGADSVFSLFNRCVTRGGAAVLEEMFQYPSSSEEAINRRSGIIGYFAKLGQPFPFQSVLFDAIEPYLHNTDERTRLSGQENSIQKKLTHLIAPNGETAMIHKGVSALAEMLRTFQEFIAGLDTGTGHCYQSERNAIAALLAEPAFAPLYKPGNKGKLPSARLSELDTLFRFRHRDTLQKVLRHLFYLDVYISVAKVAIERRFVFATALPADKQLVNMEGVYHPQVKNAVPNTLRIKSDGNVIFLTGANMAGKSTLMKSLSIALFLAHMGFPVPAERMEFSVLDGIYTTINLPDNLGMGASHFYAEVMRVKKMALELSQSKKLFIVFDELFRGTNVKDAYEATLVITEAFARKQNSLFVISTHIIEAGEVLKQKCVNIRFLYLPTRMEGNQPVYTYQLESGITDDRHGMIIINNEKILDILEAGAAKYGSDQPSLVETAAPTKR